ncbi:MAG: pyrimidine 5'-nucleotidase [Alphaproteobacteria bacterium]
MRDAFESWVFDLDNTLYPSRCDLFSQIDARMRAFIVATLGVDETEARALQKGYFHSHGTTLRGLMDHHGTDPEAFMGFVHDIDHSVVPADPALDSALARIEGRKIIFTNGSVAHAERVLERLGIPHHFEAIFDIKAAAYVPKPSMVSYETFIRTFGLDPRRAIMFDDAARNLEPAAALGMTTVWVRTESAYGREGSDGDHVHHVAADLVSWLDEALDTRSHST